MKKEIHPTYHDNATVTCSCGNSFVTGSTMPEIKTELCSACHPFYTGKQKLIDTARRVEKFHAKMSAQESVAQDRKGKKVKRAARTEAKTKKEVKVKVEKEALTEEKKTKK